MQTGQINPGSKPAFSRPRLPDYSQTPEYTITTVHPPGNDPVSGIPVHDLEGPGSMALMPIPVGKAGEGLLFSGEASPDLPVYNGGQEIPERKAHAQSESRGVSHNLPEPVRQNPLPPVSFLREAHTDESWNPPRTRTREQMELPRGRFRALKRNTGLLFLIRDMLNERFTGYCKIQLAKTPMLLVFGSGRILLASYRNLAGDAALEQILEHQYSWVDAMLHDLDDAQIQLALEFNSAWRVWGEGPGISLERETPEDDLPSPDLQGPAAGQDPSGAGAVAPPVQDMPPAGEPGRESCGCEGEQAPGWKRALRMDVGPAEVDLPARDGSEAGAEESAMRFESLGSDSDLFERRSVRRIRKGAPEPSEQWRSMSVNSLQNDSV